MQNIKLSNYLGIL